jgi:hypothetical protein
LSECISSGRHNARRQGTASGGVEVKRVEIERDKITIITGKRGESEQKNSENSWDEVLHRAAH